MEVVIVAVVSRAAVSKITMILGLARDQLIGLKYKGLSRLGCKEL